MANQKLDKLQHLWKITTDHFQLARPLGQAESLTRTHGIDMDLWYWLQTWY